MTVSKEQWTVVVDIATDGPRFRREFTTGYRERSLENARKYAEQVATIGVWNDSAMTFLPASRVIVITLTELAQPCWGRGLQRPS